MAAFPGPLGTQELVPDGRGQPDQAPAVGLFSVCNMSLMGPCRHVGRAVTTLQSTEQD